MLKGKLASTAFLHRRPDDTRAGASEKRSAAGAGQLHSAAISIAAKPGRLN
jgi:hypothetical protein